MVTTSTVPPADCSPHTRLDPEIALRRANIGARLTLERIAREAPSARASASPRQRGHDETETDRRLERIEAALFALADRLEDAENLAALAVERSEAT